MISRRFHVSIGSYSPSRAKKLDEARCFQRWLGFGNDRKCCSSHSTAVRVFSTARTLLACLLVYHPFQVQLLASRTTSAPGQPTAVTVHHCTHARYHSTECHPSLVERSLRCSWSDFLSAIAPSIYSIRLMIRGPPCPPPSTFARRT